ncbi:hypothetical protein KA005_70190, partial [bacterium]|nr:hypothetical protein [bacterium]
FASYLKDTALSVSASCIAEEFNENAVKNNMASCSTAQSVAATLKIMHLFCSPSIAERRRLGLTKCACQEDFAKHEKYWLNVLIANNVGNTVFLCGHSHVSSFRSLLSNNSYDVNVLVDYYRQDCFC